MNLLDAEKVKMPFGHYSGRTLGELGAEDPLYLSHMAQQELRDTYLNEAIATVVDKHAETIASKIRAGERPKLFDQTPSQPGPRVTQLKFF